MHPFIANHRKLLRARRHKDQYAVPFRRLVHAQAHEFHLRGDDRLINVMGADADPDLAGRLLFGFTNRRHDALVLHMP